MTWLATDPQQALDWDGVARMFPAATEAVGHLHQVLWQQLDPVLLELCRLRSAQLLGFGAGLALRVDAATEAGLGEEKIAALSHWPGSPLFTTGERACLALAEQVVIDAKGVTDELVADVLRHLSPAACYSLVEAVCTSETLQRASMVLGLPASPEANWLPSHTVVQAARGRQR